MDVKYFVVHYMMCNFSSLELVLSIILQSIYGYF